MLCFLSCSPGELARLGVPGTKSSWRSKQSTSSIAPLRILRPKTHKRNSNVATQHNTTQHNTHNTPHHTTPHHTTQHNTPSQVRACLLHFHQPPPRGDFRDGLTRLAEPLCGDSQNGGALFTTLPRVRHARALVWWRHLPCVRALFLSSGNTRIWNCTRVTCDCRPCSGCQLKSSTSPSCLCPCVSSTCAYVRCSKSSPCPTSPTPHSNQSLHWQPPLPAH